MAFPPNAQGELIRNGKDLRSGNDLSEDEVKELQAKADSDPDDVELRSWPICINCQEDMAIPRVRTVTKTRRQWHSTNGP